jgi:hypothetical protein
MRETPAGSFLQLARVRPPKYTRPPWQKQRPRRQAMMDNKQHRLLIPRARSTIAADGMQTVAARDQVEPARYGPFERNFDTRQIFPDRLYAVGENDLHVTADGVEDRLCQIAARQTDKSIAQHATNTIPARLASDAVSLVHELYAIEAVTNFAQPRQRFIRSATSKPTPQK